MANLASLGASFVRFEGHLRSGDQTEPLGARAGRAPRPPPAAGGLLSGAGQDRGQCG